MQTCFAAFTRNFRAVEVSITLVTSSHPVVLHSSTQMCGGKNSFQFSPSLQAAFLRHTPAVNKSEKSGMVPQAVLRQAEGIG